MHATFSKKGTKYGKQTAQMMFYMSADVLKPIRLKQERWSNAQMSYQRWEHAKSFQTDNILNESKSSAIHNPTCSLRHWNHDSGFGEIFHPRPAAIHKRGAQVCCFVKTEQGGNILGSFTHRGEGRGPIVPKQGQLTHWENTVALRNN